MVVDLTVFPPSCHLLILARVIRSEVDSDGSFTLTLSVPELERAFGKKFKSKTK